MDALKIVVVFMVAFAVAFSAHGQSCPTVQTYWDDYSGEGGRACTSSMTKEQDFFIAGLGNHLEFGCRLSTRENPKDSGLLHVFHMSRGSIVSVPISSEHESLKAAYTSGKSAGKATTCGPQAKLAYSEIVGWLNEKSKAGSQSKFVTGCVDFYAGRVSAEQCSCLAIVAQAAVPDIYAKTYSKGSVDEILDAEPMLALPIGVSCHVPKK